MELTLEAFCELVVTTSAPVFGLMAVCVPKLPIAEPWRNGQSQMRALAMVVDTHRQ